MKSITDLNLDDAKERKALSLVLTNIASGQIIATIKQLVESDGKYNSRDIQTAVANTGTMVDISGNLAYITVRNLNKNEVKQIRNLWQTVIHRGTVQMKEKGEDNDYYMTIDCLCVDKKKKKSYLFGCYSTPLFCSSDGDTDLWFAVNIEDCFISIDPYSEQETDYEMQKQIDRGNTIVPAHSDDDEDE